MERNLSLRKQGREQELLPKDTEGDEIFLMLPELFYLCLWFLNIKIFKVREVKSGVGSGCSTSLLIHSLSILCVLVHNFQ